MRFLTSTVSSVLILLSITNGVAARARTRIKDKTTRTAGKKENCEVGEDGSMVCKNDDNSIISDEEWGFETGCTDNHEHCSFWAESGECKNNPNYMLDNCQKSCDSCDRRKASAPRQLSNKKDETEREFLMNSIKNYGVAQQVDGADEARTMLNIQRSVSYMKNFVHSPNPTHRMSQKTIDACENKEALCSFWAVIGECDNNPSYMVTNCAPACQTCDKIDINERCGLRDDKMVPALAPGGLNAMFEKIVKNAPGNQTEASQLAAKERKVQEDGLPVYTVTIHSQPESASLSTTSESNDENAELSFDKERDHEEDPWVITFDNFLTDEECDHLIAMGHKNGYERSRDVGGLKFDGSFDSKESKSRTSANAWCDQTSGCRGDPIVRKVLDRLANATSIHQDNYEDFQILKYEVGQFYKPHHDYIEYQKDRLCGPRILTFFLYLSDVEEAGGTRFPKLDITVNPKKGRALLWPSVMNYDPLSIDERTRHEAMTVKEGLKFAANAWIHMYEYVEVSKKGCA